MTSSCARSKERMGRLRTLDERRDTILASIGEQGMLTPELRRADSVPRKRQPLSKTFTVPTNQNGARGPAWRVKKGCSRWPI